MGTVKLAGVEEENVPAEDKGVRFRAMVSFERVRLSEVVLGLAVPGVASTLVHLIWIGKRIEKTSTPRRVEETEPRRRSFLLREIYLEQAYLPKKYLCMTCIFLY